MSRSPRRKAIKALNLERKRFIVRRQQNDAALQRAANDYLRELGYLRDQFAPHIAKLVTVRVGVPWQVPELTPVVSYRALTEYPRFDDMPMLRVFSVPTGRNVTFSVLFSRDLFERMRPGHEEAIVREVAAQVERAARKALMEMV